MDRKSTLVKHREYLQTIIKYEESHLLDPENMKACEIYDKYRSQVDIKQRGLTDACWKCGDIPVPPNAVNAMLYSGIVRQPFNSNKQKVYCLMDRAQVKMDLARLPDSNAVEGAMAESTAMIVASERENIKKLDQEFDLYLDSMVRDRVRLERVIEFGLTFDIVKFGKIMTEMFGKILCSDNLLSFTQQYGMADVMVMNENGGLSCYTGIDQAYFGTAGTGKTFAIKDMIIGNHRKGVKAWGLPGRNRYCGGMSAAYFVRAGWAYEGRKFNFIVTEFNQWFNFKDSMVDILKTMMERGIVELDLKNDKIGPYPFSSFFSVNYNTTIGKAGYKVTIHDPNFMAIEDRMLCRLHQTTKERYFVLEEYSKRLRLGKIDFSQMPMIRDHLTLVYALLTGHPMVEALGYDPKTVIVTEEIEDALEDVSHEFLDEMDDDEVITWSPRLRERAIIVAAAASLMGYFKHDGPTIIVNGPEIEYAREFYREEIRTRLSEVSR